MSSSISKPSIKNALRYLMAVFYFIAGINHFVNPEFYLAVIPDYLPFHEYINIVSGIAEVIGAIALLWSKTRKIAAWGIIFMLIAFIPSHLYFIQIGSCVKEQLCVDPWIAWIRLILIHPIFIYWAWIFTKN